MNDQIIENVNEEAIEGACEAMNAGKKVRKGIVAAMITIAAGVTAFAVLKRKKIEAAIDDRRIKILEKKGYTVFEPDLLKDDDVVSD